MGDIVRGELKNRGLEITPETLGAMAKELREKEGPSAIANRCIEKIKASAAEVVFIDGLRSMDEVNYFRNEFEMLIIAVIAPDNLRHQWLLSRKRSDDGTTIEKIQERDAREIAFGIHVAIENADFIINNLGSIDELHFNCKMTFESVIAN
jgi:dephospho-CoA kinase